MGSVNNVVYVDKDAAGANNGSSWLNAFTDLQTALAFVKVNPTVTEIWVAEGAYKPTSGSDRAATFVIPNGLAVYGGFEGTESDRDARDWVTNVTTLTGDLTGDDGPNFANNDENAYRIVYFDHVNSSTILDGFTIAGANGELTRNGGGIYNDGSGVDRLSNPRIANCTFIANVARSGAGLFNDGFRGTSSPQIENCIFSGNLATRDGGAAYNFGGTNGNSSPAFINCLFTGNKAQRIGGAVFNDVNDGSGGVSNPVFMQCTFVGNEADFGIGAMNNDNGVGVGTCSPVITNCIFWDNDGQINNQNATPVVSYTLIQDGYLGTGNKNEDPVFDGPADPDGPDNTFRTIDDGLRPKVCSPAVDMGTNAGAPSSDLLGNTRPFNGMTDMGAYEYQGTGPFCTIISGTIRWSTNPALGVADAVAGVTGDDSGSDHTDVNGDYLVGLGSGADFTVTPTKTINKFNGVTAADAARIQQHIAGNAPLGAPFPRIGADVNKSGSITTADAGLITQALLGNPSANNIWNASWRFVDADYVFPNPNAPWNFPESVSLTGVSGAAMGIDFTGIKLGDVAAPFADPAMRPEPVVLRCPDWPLAVDAALEVPVSVEGFRNVAAFQFALNFDADALAFEGITTPDGGLLRPEQFGTYNVENGELRAVYAQAEGGDLASGAAFFTLHFRAKTGGAMVSDLLRLNEDLLPAEAYTPEMFIKPVQLIFGQTTSSVDPSAGTPILFAQPNPARDRTNLHFSLPAGGEAVIRVTDMSGRLVVTQKANYAAGAYVLPVELPHPGMYVAELRMATGVKLVKVVAE